MATIHLKGRAEPIEVSEEHAKEAKVLWLDYLEDKKIRHLEIGLLNTSTAEIKSIILDGEKAVGEDYVFSVAELDALDRDLESYRVDLDGRRFLSVEQEKKYLRDKNIFSQRNAIFRNRIDDYRIFENKLSALNELKDKRAFAKKKELEHLDTLADKEN